ncbi:MAG: hypothetical protein ACP5MX_01385 [Candidatus Micrarchaeia archaeon]
MVSKQGTYNPTWGSFTTKENQQGKTFIKEVVEEFKNLKSMADKLHDLENFYKAAKSKMEKQKSGIDSQYEEEIEKLKKENDKRNEEIKEKGEAEKKHIKSEIDDIKEKLSKLQDEKEEKEAKIAEINSKIMGYAKDLSIYSLLSSYWVDSSTGAITSLKNGSKGMNLSVYSYLELINEGKVPVESIINLEKSIKEYNSSISFSDLKKKYDEINFQYNAQKYTAESHGNLYSKSPQDLINEAIDLTNGNISKLNRDANNLQLELKDLDVKRPDLEAQIKKLEDNLKDLPETKALTQQIALELEEKRKSIDYKYKNEIKLIDRQLEAINGAETEISNFIKMFGGKNEGLLNKEIVESAAKEALSFFNDSFTKLLENGDIESFNKYHKEADAISKNSSKVKFDFALDFQTALEHFERYQKHIKDVSSPYHRDTAKVIVNGKTGDEAYKALVNEDAKELAKLNGVEAGLTKALSGLFLAEIIAEVNNTLYLSKGNLGSAIQLVKGLNAEKLVKIAESNGLVGNALGASKQSLAEKGTGTSTSTGNATIMHETQKPQFKIDGSQHVDERWIDEAKAYWNKLKSDANISNVSIDNGLKELEKNKSTATLANAFKVWNEINKMWLQSQNVLDKSEAEAFLKRSENATIEELEVVWREELTSFAKHKQSELNYSDSELSKMEAELYIKDGTFWPDAYLDMLERLKKFEEEQKKKITPPSTPSAASTSGTSSPQITQTSSISQDITQPPPPPMA